MPQLSRAASSEFRAWPWHVPAPLNDPSARITGGVRPQQTTVRVGPGRLDLVTRPDPSATRRPPPTAAAGCRRAPPRRRSEAFRGVPRGSVAEHHRTEPGHVQGMGQVRQPIHMGRRRLARRPLVDLVRLADRGLLPAGERHQASSRSALPGRTTSRTFPDLCRGVDRGSPPCRSQLVVGRPDASPAGPPCRYGRMPVKACGAQSRAKETSVSQRVKPRRSYTATARTLDSSTYSIA